MAWVESAGECRDQCARAGSPVLILTSIATGLPGWWFETSPNLRAISSKVASAARLKESTASSNTNLRRLSAGLAKWRDGIELSLMLPKVEGRNADDDQTTQD